MKAKIVNFSTAHNQTHRKTRVLLTFVGSMDPNLKHTTIGDVMAFYNIARIISLEIKNIELCWDNHLFELTEQCVPLGHAVQHQYSTVIFVCGPLHKGVGNFLTQFPGARKVAVGVSVPDDLDPAIVVDAWHVRDSDHDVSFDLALADIGYPHLRAPASLRRKRISICLVGRQREYKRAECSWEAEQKIREAVENGRSVDVNTLYDRARPVPESVELDLQASQIMVTTRLHGALISIFHEVPVIAIDQIEGGAKVTRLLQKVGQPVLKVCDTEPAAIAAEIERLKADPPTARMSDLRNRVVEAAREALTDARSLLLAEII